MIQTLNTELAATVCPDCGEKNAVMESVDIGTPGMSPITSGTARYYCFSCHFVAWGADALRANGVATDALVPASWRESARKYTARMRGGA